MENINKSECEVASRERMREKLHEIIDKIEESKNLRRVYNLAIYVYLRCE